MNERLKAKTQEADARDASCSLDEALRQAPEAWETEFDARTLEPGSLKRRMFLQRMGAAGLGAAAISLLSGCGGDDDDNGGGGPRPVPVATATPTAVPVAPGVDQTNFPGITGSNINFVVLNFALALETLEADLYRQALNVASGLPVSTPLQATRNYTLRVPAGSLNAQAGSAAVAFDYLRDFSFIEATHRDFLRTTLRTLGASVQPPNPGGYQFPGGRSPGADLRAILTAILPLEETGVRAYLGAAGFLTQFPLIQTASTIYSTEARHSAIVAYTIGRTPGPVRQAGDQLVTTAYPSPDTFEYFLAPRTVLTAIQPFFDTDNSGGRSA